MYVEMSGDTASLSVIILLSFLSIIVCISNAFTVFVFWVHQSKLKRTSFLVINLAVADLLIGLTDTVEVGVFALPRHIGSNETITEMKGSIVAPFVASFSCASVFFLVLISLERAFALIWPLRHRVTSRKVYTYSVGIAWLAGITIGVFSFLAVVRKYQVKYFAVAATIIIGFSLITICVSYLSIRKKN